jgi:hypothetical protein
MRLGQWFHSKLGFVCGVLPISCVGRLHVQMRLFPLNVSNRFVAFIFQARVIAKLNDIVHKFGILKTISVY